MKKVFLILLATLLVLSMAACGQTEEPTEPSTEPATQATESKPIAPVSSATPTLSSGSGCAGDNATAE